MLKILLLILLFSFIGHTQEIKKEWQYLHGQLVYAPVIQKSTGIGQKKLLKDKEYDVFWRLKDGKIEQKTRALKKPTLSQKSPLNEAPIKRDSLVRRVRFKQVKKLSEHNIYPEDSYFPIQYNFSSKSEKPVKPVNKPKSKTIQEKLESLKTQKQKILSSKSPDPKAIKEYDTERKKVLQMIQRESEKNNN